MNGLIGGWKQILILGGMLMAFHASLSGATLQAGTAKADITPPPGVPMWGYTLRKASGTMDPLFARVLVLGAGDSRVAIVTLDLGRAFGPATTEEIRNAVRRSSGISSVVLAASHDHSAPVVQDAYRDGRPAWEEEAVQRIEQAINEATLSAVDVRIGVGYGVCYIGYSRLEVQLDGKAKWLGSNPTEAPTSPVDPTVTVVRLDRLDGIPLAILVNYACHPVVFGSDNTRYSADYPGVMCDTVRGAFAEKPLVMFLQGAAGNINPYHATTPLREDAVKWRDWTGSHLGEEVVRVANSIQTKVPAAASLDFVEDVLPFQFRWNFDTYRQAVLSSDEITSKSEAQSYYDAYAPASPGAEQHLAVGTVLIDKEIAIMTVPGEAFVSFQMDWRNRCPVNHCLFAGYANGYSGYFPTIRAATQGGYGANSFMTWVEPGAGERMVNQAVIRVYQMLGLLTDNPAL